MTNLEAYRDRMRDDRSLYIEARTDGDNTYACASGSWSLGLALAAAAAMAESARENLRVPYKTFCRMLLDTCEKGLTRAGGTGAWQES